MIGQSVKSQCKVQAKLWFWLLDYKADNHWNIWWNIYHANVKFVDLLFSLCVLPVYLCLLFQNEPISNCCFILFYCFVLQAFNDSLNPHLIDELLYVLRLEDVGKPHDASRIEEIYHREIARHERCDNCTKGMETA